MLSTRISRTSPTPIRAGNAAEVATEEAYAGVGRPKHLGGANDGKPPSPVAAASPRRRSNPEGGRWVCRLPPSFPLPLGSAQVVPHSTNAFDPGDLAALIQPTRLPVPPDVDTTIFLSTEGVPPAASDRENDVS
jgi:hypothetical protein